MAETRLSRELDKSIEDAIAQVTFEFADRCAANAWKANAAMFIAICADQTTRAVSQVLHERSFNRRVRRLRHSLSHLRRYHNQTITVQRHQPALP